MKAECYQVGNLTSYTHLLFQILHDGEESSDDVDEERVEIMRANSAVSSLKRHSAPRKARKAGKKKKKRNKQAITTSSMIRNLLIRSKAELLDVIIFHCLDTGCQHVQRQISLSTGGLVCGSSFLAPCGNKYTICTGEWRKVFLPVRKVYLLSFLHSGHMNESLPLEAKHENLVDLLWKAPKRRGPV